MKKILSLFLLMGLLGCEVEQDAKDLENKSGGGTTEKGTLFESTGKNSVKKNDIIGLWESEMMFTGATSELVRIRFAQMSVTVARACQYNNGLDLFVQTTAPVSYTNTEIKVEQGAEKSVSGKQSGFNYECAVAIDKQIIPHKIYDGKIYIENHMYTKISD